MIRFPMATYILPFVGMTALLMVSLNAFALPSPSATSLIYVAHAGGALNGVTYANCLEALEASYINGFRLFELDFNWTSDGRLVLIHDWEENHRKLFGAAPGSGRPTLKAFKRSKMMNGMTPTSLEELAKWLKRRPDARIITDVKEDNLKALALVRKRLGVKQVLPQIFFFEEYGPVRALGFQDVILMLYRANYKNDAVVDFAERHALFAVAMPNTLALESDLARRLNKSGIAACAQTVEGDVEPFQRNGVGCFYTDFLKPVNQN